MNAKITVRMYVWTFCFYLFVTLQWVFSKHLSTPLSHLDFSLFTAMDLFGQLFAAWIIWSILFNNKGWNRIERLILILTGSSFVLVALVTIHRFGYFPYIPRQISHWLFFTATILVGYRMDQVLKAVHNQGEANSLSTADANGPHE